jgi:hypothetical protein
MMPAALTPCELLQIYLLRTWVNRGAATSPPAPPPSLCAARPSATCGDTPGLVALYLFAEDAAIHEVLYAMLQGFGQRRDHQRGDYHTQPGLPLLGDDK